MNLPLFRHTLAANAVRLLVIAAGMVLMGVIMPVMYGAFGQEIGEFIESVPFFSRMVSNFGGGDLMSLPGSVAMGFSHPFTLLLVGVMAIAFPALAIAGERDKGTLEVTLSRPISRRGLLVTLFTAGVLFVLILISVLVLTTGVTTYVIGLGHEFELSHLAQLWLSSSLLFISFMALAFATSVEADRPGPAIGIPAVFLMLNYLAFAIGSIWPDVKWLSDYSIFSLLKARETLIHGFALSDVAVLLLFIVVFAGFAWYRFPRRDLPAPS
jgi:ABC-2 type transport system permease protein